MVVGDEDAFTTREDASKTAWLRTDCDLQWMPGVGHMPNSVQADKFDAALLRLLERAQATAS